MKALEITCTLRHGFLHTQHPTPQEEPMAPMTRTERREYHAKHRRSQKYRERLQREQARAQRSLEVLEQTLGDLGLPETLAVEVQWRLKRVGKLLGKIVGLMFP